MLCHCPTGSGTICKRNVKTPVGLVFLLLGYRELIQRSCVLLHTLSPTTSVQNYNFPVLTEL